MYCVGEAGGAAAGFTYAGEHVVVEQLRASYNSARWLQEAGRLRSLGQADA